jgi:hypothetical protein
MDLKKDEGYVCCLSSKPTSSVSKIDLSQYPDTVFSTLDLMYDGERMAGTFAHSQALRQRKHAAYVERYGEASMAAKPESNKTRPVSKSTKPKPDVKFNKPYAAFLKLSLLNRVEPRSQKNMVIPPEAKPLPKLVTDANITITTYHQSCSKPS